jgi:hypothetical protein
LAVTVSVAFVAIVVGWVWVFGASGDTACLDAYPDLPEGSAFHEEAKLWPPGTKCVYELPNGRDETRSTFP